MGDKIINIYNILYIDTESNPDTFKCEAIQTYFNGNIKIYKEFNDITYQEIKEMWQKADAILFFNAPYDMGVLSYAFKNNHAEWRIKKVYGKNGNASFWFINLFECKYAIRKINKKFNRIKNLSCEGFKKDKNKKTYRPKFPPIIDLLKLWSIFIDDGGINKIGLKDIIQRELNIETISWKDRNKDYNKYLEQDVKHLPLLFEIFLNKVGSIDSVKDFTLQDWSDIKTNASITKKAYEDKYPHLKTYSTQNKDIDKKYRLSGGLESAYFGGLTIALYRGWINDKTVWYDVKSSYASVISIMNLDKYLLYDFKELSISEIDNLVIDRDNPYLLKCESNMVMQKSDGSLKLFKLKEPISTLYYWSFDILVLKYLFKQSPQDDWKPYIKILKGWKPIPLLDVNESLPKKWAEEKKKYKKGDILYDYYKLLSNTSYGIKAQRKPFETKHTNLVIAGIITSRARLTLMEMKDEAEKLDMDWIYSDTDSVCMRYKNCQNIDKITKKLSDRISPYSLVCEHYNHKTLILSLKRYLSFKGSEERKVKLHGKGATDINENTMFGLIVFNTQIPDDNISIYQLSANTEISRKILAKKINLSIQDVPPFSFRLNIKTDKSYKDWFNDWYYHIDKKLSFNKHSNKYKYEPEYKREFLLFDDIDKADKYYYSKDKNKIISIDDNIDEICYDDILKYYFKDI